MNAELRVHAHKQVHLIGQDFQFFDVSLMLLAHLDDDLSQPAFKRLHEHLSPILWTPDHMIMARIVHILIASVCLAHRISIHHRVIYCQELLFFFWVALLLPQQGTRLSSP